ncbi:uncharacterized protein PG986_008837 [Apiospora aurea]|uniref:Heterokaryon incompatibility domain-containing protein n=1 Tax=Apiospora aurea TaxID=335848 RepID=A0ABR1Q780_9PEZI
MDPLSLKQMPKDPDILCAVCEAIDWSEITRQAQEEVNACVEVRRFSPSDSHQELRSSRCQICRALATIKPAELDVFTANCILASGWPLAIGPHRPQEVHLYVLEESDVGKQGTNRDIRALCYKAASNLGFLVFSGPCLNNKGYIYSLISQQPTSVSTSLRPLHERPQGIFDDTLSNPSREALRIRSMKYRGSGEVRLLDDYPDFAYIKNAERHCRAGEPNCQGPRGSVPELRLRVIDCHTIQVVEAPANSEYVALSYVWGDAITTFDCQSKEPTFPIVVQDSIKVTLSLEYRYLWVDRHCISQDSAHKEHMIHRMDEVYKRAAIVIIATTGKSADDGLPGISVRRSTLREVTVGSFTFRPIPPHGLEFLRNTRWATRGWAYQEGYLARRRLFFTKSQVIFICDCKIFPESMPSGLALMDPGESITALIRGPGTSWTAGYRPISHRLGSDYPRLTSKLMEFSSRKLTHDDDSLQAFLGILNDHKDGSDLQHHLWGVPILPKCPPYSSRIALDWTHKASLTARRRHGFPSWSWAGWEGTAVLPSYRSINISMMYLDEERHMPLETVYRDCGMKKSWPRHLYLRAKVTEVTFVPGNLVKALQGYDYHGKYTHPEMLAVLPVTETEHMASAAFIDEPVEMMTPYPAVILKEYEPRKSLSIPEGQSEPSSRATLLVMKRLDDHFERVGIVTVGPLTPYADMGPVNLGLCSADLTTGNAQLSTLAGPNRLTQQKWRQHAVKQTICLG